MKKIIKLTEKDLNRLIKRVLQEQSELTNESITDCIFKKIQNGELKTPPFEFDRFLGVVNDLKPLVQACSEGIASWDCMSAGWDFAKKHTQDAKDLLPYITQNITIIAPCFLNGL